MLCHAKGRAFPTFQAASARYWRHDRTVVLILRSIPVGSIGHQPAYVSNYAKLDWNWRIVQVVSNVKIKSKKKVYLKRVMHYCQYL